jgi:hypothetical protein
MPKLDKTVIHARAGIQFIGLIALKSNQMLNLDFRRSLPSNGVLGGGNDGRFSSRLGEIHNLRDEI